MWYKQENVVHLSLYLGYHSADKFIVQSCSTTRNAFLALWYVTVYMCFSGFLLINSVDKLWLVLQLMNTCGKSLWWIFGASGFERRWFYVSDNQGFYFEVLAFMCCIVDLALFHK